MFTDNRHSECHCHGKWYRHLFLIATAMLTLVTYCFAQNVGINTQSPLEKLHVKSGGLLIEGEALVVGEASVPDTFLYNDQIPFPDSSGHLFDNGGPDGPYTYPEGTHPYAIDMSNLDPLAIRLEIVQMDLAPDDSLIIDNQFVFRNGDLGTVFVNGFYAYMEFIKTGAETADGFEIIWHGLFEVENVDSIAIEGTGSRFMWVSGKRALRSGRVVNNKWDIDSIGLYSTALGFEVLASGDYALASGEESYARGESSVAMGNSNTTTGFGSIALGVYNRADGGAAVAMGNGNQAIGSISTAIGRSNIVTGNDGSAAIGIGSTVSNNFGSVAIGSSNDVSGRQGSVALGDNNQVPGFFGAIAIGSNNRTDGEWAPVAIGFNNTVDAKFGAIAMGMSVTTTGRSSVTIGRGLSPFGNSNNLENSIHNSLMVGFLSDIPTLFVGPADSTSNSLGKIGIGTTTPGDVISNAILEVSGGHIALENNYGIFSNNEAGTGIGAGFDTNTDDDLKLFAGGASHVTILANGDVGIGNASPLADLHITGDENDGTISALRVSSGASNLLIDGNEVDAMNGALFLQNNSNTNLALVIGGGSVGIGTVAPATDLEISKPDGASARLTSGSGSDVFLDFKRTGSDWRVVNDGGLLFFGQSNDDLTSVINVLRLGGGSVTPAEDDNIILGQSSRRWTEVWAVDGTINTSDKRLKTNVRPTEYGLEQIMQLVPVQFQWKYQTTPDNKARLGFLAQDLQSVLPEVVVDHSWNYDEETGAREWVPVENLGVRYAEIIPVLVNAIQEQQVIIEKLTAQLQAESALNESRENALLIELKNLREKQELIMKHLDMPRH